ncbi:2189_t:CDS:2 [Scutellospora calospora]|uniref:2189_t:CDS:1 n=1 Tax=Scutellospora calospora TaxID=85575 RepID=A0ACA9MDU6_9GLOM|nr:2189_t:CDS:2 [Scutellospora calospora]
MFIIQLPNEILIDIFKRIKILINVIDVCRQFRDTIVNPSFKIQWLSFHYEIFPSQYIIDLGFTFFDIETVKTIFNSKNFFIDKTKESDIIDVIAEVGIELHLTKKLENRVKALEIFMVIGYNQFLGYYYEKGYGGLEINIEKAMEYYKISAYEDNDSYVMCRYALYLIESNKDYDGKLKTYRYEEIN